MGQYEYDNYHDGTGSPGWGPASGDYDDDRPSASDLAAEQDRHLTPDEMTDEGLQEPPQGEHGDPGFPEEEVDDWPDPDIGHENRNPDRPLPFGTPTYNPRSSPYEDYDPNSAENLPPDEVGPGRHEAPHWMAYQSPRKHKHEREGSHRIGAILTQAEQWPFRVGYDQDATPYREFGHSGVGNLDDDEYMVNTDPNMGSTVPEPHGGWPKGAITDARVMMPEETGLEYPVLARPSPKGKGFDVIKPLG